MTAPIVTDILITPNPVPTGGTARIEIVAHDPDEGAFTVTGTVTDAAGNAATFTATGRTTDPLTFEAAVDIGTLTQDMATPNVFYWTP
jgi:hypothetical protein